jgi:hypothetical protein
MILVAWFLLLVVQNAAFTWVSRARNSGSIGYHAVASVASNGIWFASQFFLIGLVAKPGMPFADAAILGAIYIAGTVTGSVLMHIASIRWLEKGSRRVGATTGDRSDG